MRIDKWLWVSRFFKTRALAVKACEMGRIECNGQTAKPSKEIKAGDMLEIRLENAVFVLEALSLSETRGPAAVAQTLYRETEESKAARAKAAEQRRAVPHFEAEREGKPSKRDRRELNRVRGRGY